MSRQKTAPPTSFFPWSAAFAAAAFWLTHALWLAQVPGLHYDEAWAGNFAARILEGGGSFLPFTAQSPYTAAWGHYAGALAFKLFGVSLFVFRLSQALWVWVGILLGGWALELRSGRRAGVAFVWISGFSLAMVLNHRFAIDVNTFHVFCLGLLAWGLAIRERYARVGLAVAGLAGWLGVTSHLGFLGPLLGLYGAAYLRGPWGRRERAFVVGFALLLLPRFAQVLVAIPEKDKAVALIAVTVAAAALGWYQPKVIRSRAFLWAREHLKAPALVLLVTLFAVFLFFWEGHWTALFFMGGLHARWLVGASALLVLVLLVSRLQERGSVFRGGRTERDLRDWFLATLVVMAALMTKPAGRYFETCFVLFSAVLALVLSSLPPLKARLWLACFVLVSALALEENYLRPGREFRQDERDVRALVFRDSTADTLPKQAVVGFLAENGCGPAVTIAADPRIDEALKFLARGDWEVEHRPCPWKQVLVARESQAGKMDWIISRLSGFVLIAR